MTIAWELFTPAAALGGGLLIGLAAAVLVLGLGRIAGISGIVGKLLQAETWHQRSEWMWRLAFVLGMLAAPVLWMCFAQLPAMEMPNNTALVILAGLLVGVGTRMGSGCTSGHGVCGLSRLSARSLAAVLVFMATGALTVFVVRHVVGA